MSKAIERGVQDARDFKLKDAGVVLALPDGRIKGLVDFHMLQMPKPFSSVCPSHIK